MTDRLPKPAPHLHINGGKYCGQTQHWKVEKSLLIGRENADITIALSSISRRHAQVAVHNSSLYTIQDLNSKNGTAVNGNYLGHQPYQLKHGDLIVIASVLELRYDDPCATPFAQKLGKLSGLWIDVTTEDVWVDAEKLTPPLSKAQLKLLQTIVAAHGSIVSRDEIVANLWGDSNADVISNDAVDSLIKRLRRRLSAIEHGDPVLEVVRGRGIRHKQGR